MSTNIKNGLTSHDRRSVLRTLAVGAGTLPFAGLSGHRLLPFERSAYAQTGGPRRIVIIHDPNGLHQSRGWKDFAAPGSIGVDKTPMQGAGYGAKAASVTTDFALGAMLQPVAKYKDQMNVFDSFTRLPATTDHHTGGTMGLLTAATLTETIENRIFYNVPLTRSVDQHMAAKVGSVVTPKFPTLTLAAQYAQSQQWHTLSWLDGKQLVAPEDDTYKLYTKLFSGLMKPGQPAPTGPSAADLAQLARRRSVLDAVTRDLGGFVRKLQSDDRKRAEAQLTAIRTLETQLGANMSGSAAVMCQPPTFMPGLQLAIPQNHMAAVHMQMQLIVAALACDLSRIVTLYLQNRYNDGASFDPINQKRDIHGCSHDAQDAYVKIRTMHFGEVAYLCDSLAAIPEAGATMLDHTLIVCLTECSHGHTCHSMPWLSIGGRALGVKTGRYFVLPNMTPHKRLLVSLLNIMGVDEDNFGVDSTTQQGDLDYGGGPIDLGRGPLSGFPS